MFCPKCGQQQSSDEIRFCPKCGLSLVHHAALLAGGDAASVGLAGAQAPARTGKQINTRRAAKLMFFSVVFVPVFIGLSVLADGGEPLLVPFLAFLAGLAWLVYARLFGDESVRSPRDQDATRRDLGAAGARPALDAPLFVPASSFQPQRADTAEMAPPPSVTENSTKLLDKDL